MASGKYAQKSKKQDQKPKKQKTFGCARILWLVLASFFISMSFCVPSDGISSRLVLLVPGLIFLYLALRKLPSKRDSATSSPRPSSASSQPATTAAASKQPRPAYKKPAVPAGCTVRKYRVAGTSFCKDNIMALASENADYSLSKTDIVDGGMEDRKIWQYDFYVDAATLEPEPDNPNDPNAIKVIVDGEHVGYIKSGSCAHVLKLINEGRLVKIDCEICGGRFKRVSSEYDDEKEKDVYTMERGEYNFWVDLSITEKNPD